MATLAAAGAVFGARERVTNAGVEAAGDAELVALVLGTGTAREPVSVLAAALLEEHGGLAGLARAGPGALTGHAGVGDVKGARLAAAVELGRRVAACVARPAELRLPYAAAVDAWARPRLVALDHEELWVLALDAHHGLRAARRVAMGGLHGVSLAARDPLRVTLREGGSAMVLVHNHPSGDPTPSREDVVFTRRVARAGEVVGVPLLDHVVVARSGFTSLLGAGHLDAAASTGRGDRGEKP